jgi:hypothetical protein
MSSCDAMTVCRSRGPIRRLSGDVLSYTMKLYLCISKPMIGTIDSLINTHADKNSALATARVISGKV